MTDLNPELIERAAKALWDEPGWDRASHEQRLHHREAAERALSAVLPDIIQQAKAEALRDAAGSPIPRGALARETRIWLRARADRIEQGGQP